MHFIKLFKNIRLLDLPVVGGRNAYLGEVRRIGNIRTPDGFVVTVAGYDSFLSRNNLSGLIKDKLSTIKINDINNITQKGNDIRQLFLNSEIPDILKVEIIESYRNMEEEFFTGCDVAVRSSICVDGRANHPFEDLQETFLNIRGTYDLLDACKRCFASLFTSRGIVHMLEHKMGFDSVKISLGIQKMIRSDMASSGILYTIDNETGFSNVIHIKSMWGISQRFMLEHADPDEFYVFKPKIGSYRSILSKKFGEKNKSLVYDMQGTKSLKIANVDLEHQRAFSLNDNEIIRLAKKALDIENELKMPLEVEWAKDGDSDKFYIIDVQPERIHSKKDFSLLSKFVLSKKSKAITVGESVGHSISQGRANVLKDYKEGQYFRKDQILVTNNTDGDWEPIMKLASAVVINRNGKTSHAAIFCRENSIPCIVGTKNATKMIKTGQNVTVDCSTEMGFVYEGLLDFTEHHYDISKIPKTRTKIMLKISSKNDALKHSYLPCDGVGLASMEYLVNSEIKIHPKALIDFHNIKDIQLKTKINEMTPGYSDKKNYYIDKLSYGIGMIAAAFYPKEVILRLTDFNSKEYSELVGGKDYEKEEMNPLMGLRGVSRYRSNQDIFDLECLAIERAIKQVGLDNISLMIPFCRTIDEANYITKTIDKRIKVKKYLLCDLPSNIIMADGFLKYFDGLCIGFDDLSQMSYGFDKENEFMSSNYSAHDDAIKKMIEMASHAAKKNGKTLGFCGDAPWEINGFAEFLLNLHIDSITLTPDAFIPTKIHIARAENYKTI